MILFSWNRFQQQSMFVGRRWFWHWCSSHWNQWHIDFFETQQQFPKNIHQQQWKLGHSAEIKTKKNVLKNMWDTTNQIAIVVKNFEMAINLETQRSIIINYTLFQLSLGFISVNLPVEKNCLSSSFFLLFLSKPTNTS